MFEYTFTMDAAIFLGNEALLTTQARINPLSAPVVESERPVARCSHCRLVQYRTAQSRCRRCYFPLTAPVVVPPPPPIPQRPDVAAGVRNWRRMCGLTQKQLAFASHLPRTYISRIENGRIIPGLVTLERVADALGVALPALLVAYSKSNGNGNGNGQARSNGNGNGTRFPDWAPEARPEADVCLREILRYSGMLTGAQRRLVLARVRELFATRLALCH